MRRGITVRQRHKCNKKRVNLLTVGRLSNTHAAIAERLHLDGMGRSGSGLTTMYILSIEVLRMID